MPRPDKRSFLLLLTKERLRELAEGFKLSTKSGLRYDELIELLAGGRRASFKRAELKGDLSPPRATGAMATFSPARAADHAAEIHRAQALAVVHHLAQAGRSASRK
jgi:hypothetical protein